VSFEKLRWELYLHADGRHRWYDPENRFGSKPPELDWTYHHTFAIEAYPYRIAPRALKHLPDGALGADPEPQSYGMGGPRLLYRDLERRCKICRADFLFSAEQQKRWYEEYGLLNEIIAVRCPPCARTDRTERADQKLLMDAHAALRAAPRDAGALLGVARATAALADRVGAAALDRAVGAARRAARRTEHAAEAETVLVTLIAARDSRD